MTILHHPPLVLRPFTTDDAPAFSSAVRESLASLHPWMPWAHEGYDEAAALAWFAICDASRANGTGYEFGLFNADDGRFLGGGGLNQINILHHFCNLGYWVRSSAQRQGVALAAVQALSRHAFDSLGLTRVEIVTAVGNHASYGVAIKAGAMHEGRCRNRLVLRGVPVAADLFSLVP